MRVRSMMKRVAAFVNPPGMPGDMGSFPPVRDYPIERRSSLPGRTTR